MSEHGLIVPFTEDPSPSFVNGFEAGMVWMDLNNSIQIVDRTVHSANKLLIERMCRVFKKRAHFEDCIYQGEVLEDWTVLTVKSLLEVVK